MLKALMPVATFVMAVICGTDKVTGIFAEALRPVLTQVLLQKKALTLNPITRLYYISPCSYIEYVIKKIDFLLQNDITPIMVFDGIPFPSKIVSEQRARLKEKRLGAAKESEDAGDTEKAIRLLDKSLKVTPLMAYNVIQALKKKGVKYIVAPYEADAQIAFLAINQRVDWVIAEDSDLLLYGCPNIIFEIHEKEGQFLAFRDSALVEIEGMSSFSKQMLVEMCVLGGCDYLKALPNVGLQVARDLITRFRSYDGVLEHWKRTGKDIRDGYEGEFRKALMIFKHQMVYHEEDEKLVHLTELRHGGSENLDYLGPQISPILAKGVAVGDINPWTMKAFEECD